MQVHYSLPTSQAMMATESMQPDNFAEDSDVGMHEAAAFYALGFSVSLEHALHLIAASDEDRDLVQERLFNKDKPLYWVDKWRNLQQSIHTSAVQQPEATSGLASPSPPATPAGLHDEAALMRMPRLFLLELFNQHRGGGTQAVKARVNEHVALLAAT